MDARAQQALEQEIRRVVRKEIGTLIGTGFPIDGRVETALDAFAEAVVASQEEDDETVCATCGTWNPIQPHGCDR